MNDREYLKELEIGNTGIYENNKLRALFTVNPENFETFNAFGLYVLYTLIEENDYDDEYEVKTWEYEEDGLPIITY